MQKSDAYDFLIRAAIPPVLDERNIPDALKKEKKLREVGEGSDEKTGDKAEKAKKYIRNEWIWRSVHRAHRDVVVRSQNVEKYSCFKTDRNKPNQIEVELYEKITECLDNDDSSELDPRNLICLLKGKFNKAPYGRLQKLVNMTFKYLLILNTFGAVQVDTSAGREIIRIGIPDEENLDCPLDSAIISTLDGSFQDVSWTSLDDFGKYESIQDAIGRKSGSDSRIMYDFKNWQ